MVLLPSPALRGLEIKASLLPPGTVLLTYPTAFTEKTCAMEVATPAALKAAVRSSVFVLIFFVFLFRVCQQALKSAKWCQQIFEQLFELAVTA
jgi:hypothetical protein